MREEIQLSGVQWPISCAGIKAALGVNKANILSTVLFRIGHFYKLNLFLICFTIYLLFPL